MRRNGATDAFVGVAVLESRCACCGSREARVVYSACTDRLHLLPGAWDVVACGGCGLARTESPPSPDEIRAYYPRTYVSFAKTANGLSPARRSIAAALRAPHRLRWRLGSTIDAPHPAARALDVGCGNGVFLRELKRRGWEPFGIEPNADVAEEARRSVGSARNILVAAAEDATLPAQSFELVSMFHVLEHLHDPVGVLRRAREWLTEDGVLRIRVPNIGSLESWIFGRLWFGLDVPRHLHHFSAKTLDAVLVRAGFRLDTVVPEFQASSLAGSVSHAIDSMRRRRREYRHSAWLYNAALPFVSLASPLGWAATIDVTARKAGVRT